MNKALYFLLGVGVGVAGTYFYLKDKYEKYTQEEIDSVKEAYRTKGEPVSAEPEEEKVEIKNVKPDIDTLFPDKVAKKVKEYKNYATKFERPEDPVHKPFSEEPEIISEEEFGEIDEYEKLTLTYYSDGVLAEELSDEIVENADELVGSDYIQKLEDSDAVYVRNDIEKTDYEIVKNLQTYKEVTGNDPTPAETEE